MTETNRNSTVYANAFVNNVVPNFDTEGGRVVPRRLAHTFTSSDDSDDSVNLTVIRPGEYIVGLFLVGNGLGASAGTGVTITLKAKDDAATDTTISVAADMDLTAASVALAFNGMHYTPGVGKAVVRAVISGAAPTAGKKIEGYLLVVAG
jgi:hypothetical protein